jgi:hypothetical protein
LNSFSLSLSLSLSLLKVIDLIHLKIEREEIEGKKKKNGQR